MTLNPRCVYVTSTGRQVTLALCEQSGWLGTYHEEQDIQNVGGDRSSHCVPCEASPEEMVDGEGREPGVLPDLTPGLLLTLDK